MVKLGWRLGDVTFTSTMVICDGYDEEDGERGRKGKKEETQEDGHRYE